MKIKCTILILMLVLIGCVSVNKTLLNPSPTDKLFIQSEVQVYFASDEIPENTRVAFLAGKGNVSFTDESDLIERFREEAGKLGANAIILEYIEDPSSLDTTPDRKARAMAIYVPSLDDKKK